MNTSLAFSQGVRGLADNYKDLYDTKYNNLCSLILYFLFGFHSLSNLVRNVPGANSVSTLCETTKKFEVNLFMQRHQKNILKKFINKINVNDYCFAIDDTDIVKCGNSFYSCGDWRGSKGIYFGQRVVVLSLIDIKNSRSIPIDYRFAIKKEDPNYKSGLDLGIEMLEIAVARGFPKLTVVCDSWFDSVDFFKNINKIGLNFVIEIKSNRNAHLDKDEEWLNIKKLFQGLKRYSVAAKLYPKNDKEKKKLKWYSEKIIFIKNYCESLKTIATFDRKNSKKPFAFYCTDNHSITGAKIWMFTRARWNIECMFRDLKQNLNFGKLGCSGKAASDLAVCMPFIIYTSLLLECEFKWGISHSRSIGSMITELKQKNGDETIKKILYDNKQYAHKINLLKKRRDTKRINKKPTNGSAEDSFHSEKVFA